MDLAVRCYACTERLPRDEVYGLRQQIRRAAASVAANIAEGHGREHVREFTHQLSIARGSLMEVETLLQLAHRLRFLDQESVEEVLGLSGEVGRLLNGLLRSLRRKLKPPVPGPWSLTPDP